MPDFPTVLWIEQAMPEQKQPTIEDKVEIPAKPGVSQAVVDFCYVFSLSGTLISILYLLRTKLSSLLYIIRFSKILVL